MKKFDKIYKYYDGAIKFFNLNKKEEIKEALKLKGDEIVLDVGGGTGRLAEFLSPESKEYYILDESEGMLSRVKKASNVFPVFGDARNLEFEDLSFDIAIMSDTIHHIKNHEKLFEEIARVLKPNGRLLILDFEKYSFKTRILRACEFFLFGKTYFMTSDEARSLTEKYFKIVDFIKKGYYYIIVGEKNV
ncbi:MAG TPA: class I SAM-dependent methyltransferase [Spirochaetota bacterium]|nr:class I SAM-dependent methyltransferase [Spirochaetota bacterium]HOS33190.1 class I SAM-dependent methyltransferase [Spirochaetota bacterium]HOS56430.1 class I SAM-dependent methyltransferase [Spirochaetota bacterium]HPK61351.1 class I SAM-dependent methyltransferase [Spirochaetota bacterium]HQF78272.1 class I SAM-dependent methyltransferase [Spirochaetota bacterium]